MPCVCFAVDRYLAGLRRFAYLLPVLALLFFGAFSGPALSQEDTAPEDLVETPEELAEVILDGETLFSLAGTSAYPAEERAATVVERLIEAAEAAPGKQPVVEVKPEEFGPAIYANGVMIVVVTETDAEAEGFPQDIIAETYRASMERALVAYHSDRSDEGLERSAIEALLWTVAFGLLVVVVLAGRRMLRRQLQQRINVWLSGLEEKSGQTVKSESIFSACVLLLRGLFIVIFLVMFYYYIAIILNSFAFTRTIADLLLDIVAAPLVDLVNTAIGEIPDIFTLVVIIFITRYLLKLVRLFFDNIENGLIKIGNFERDWIWPTYWLARVILVLMTVVVAYPYIPGSSSDAFKGMTILFGVLLSFGSNSIVSNLLAGLFVIYRRSVNIGDYVQIGEWNGDVESVTFLETQLRSDFNELISIPNATILNSEVKNFSRTGATTGLIVSTVVGIGYDEPQAKITRLLIQAARKTKGVKVRPGPCVLRLSLNAFDISYRLNAYVKKGENIVRLHSDLNENVLDELHGAGVQIMTPAYIADPAEAKIPD